MKLNIEEQSSKSCSSAVVCQLFRKPVNLLQKAVGYQITFIHSSDLYFLSIHANLLELDHQCVHM